VGEAIVVQHFYSEGSTREIQLELIRVRAEAAAARLEARAAELELVLLAQQTAGSDVTEPIRQPRGPVDGDCDSDAAMALMAAISKLIEAGPERESGTPTLTLVPNDAPSEPPTQMRTDGPGWGDRLQALQGRRADPTVNAIMVTEPDPEQAVNETCKGEPENDHILERTPNPQKVKRIDAASKRTPEPAVGLVSGSAKTLPGERLPAELAIDADGVKAAELKRKPAAWIASTLAHVAVLLLLGLMTLANPQPRDQLALSASASEASDEALESITIEALESMPESSQTMPAEAAVEVSPLGELAMTEVSLDLPPAQSVPKTSDLMREVSSSTAQLSKAAVKADQPSNVKFAGVDGGGNHFVYLVDSSNSMRNFNEARTELLRSIDSLRPDQRFYVVFYDQTPEFMRLKHPASDEPASVLATIENKTALRRWAMAVQQERGKSPTEVLPFAFKLRPDVIFLLSDGEFSAQTEQVIRENNHQENLFGDAGPISIIHTIRYPGFSTAEGRDAEVQMRRIAAENGGQYRNVAVP